MSGVSEKRPCRAVVFAYSSVGCECLKVLLERGVDVRLLYTHRDDPGEVRWFDSVGDLARSRGLSVLTPDVLSGEVERVRSAAPDVIFSFYYRSLIPMSVLSLAPLGAFNLHGSLLPRYRGRACVNWAVLNGEPETGVTLHHMTAWADRGNVVDRLAVHIGPDETAIEVFRKLVPAAGAALRRSLGAILAGEAEGTPQDESRTTTFGRRRPADGLMDWTQDARALHNLVRAVAWPFPGAFTFLEGRKLMVWRTRPSEGTSAASPGTVLRSRPPLVAAGRGALEILQAQWADEWGEKKKDGLEGDDACPHLERGILLGGTLK